MNDRNYIVFFEIFGRRMKTTVLAENEEQAKRKVIDKLVFHKVVIKQGDDFNDVMEILDGVSKLLEKK